MHKKIGKIFFRKWLIGPALAIICFATNEIFSRNTAFVETFYSQKFYPFLANILSRFSAIAPFSLDDTFYLLLILAPFILVFLLLIGKITFKTAGKYVLNTLAGIYILFYVLWGFNYFRPRLNERLDLAKSETNKEAFVAILDKLIDDTNAWHCSLANSNKAVIDSLIEDSYKTLASVLKIHYPMGIRNDKKITFSRFYAQSGITGYFGPFFNEVHVNKNVLPLEYPFILAHEKAHQLGITSEAEANFYAWLVCTKSNSQQLHYSANLIILRHFLIQAYSMKEYPELVAKIDTSVRSDFATIRQHWQGLRNERMDKVASKVNDAYLKTNKIEGGIKDYHGVVQHVMNFSLDSAFQSRLDRSLN